MMRSPRLRGAPLALLGGSLVLFACSDPGVIQKTGGSPQTEGGAQTGGTDGTTQGPTGGYGNNPDAGAGQGGNGTGGAGTGGRGAADGSSGPLPDAGQAGSGATGGSAGTGGQTTGGDAGGLGGNGTGGKGGSGTGGSGTGGSGTGGSGTGGSGTGGSGTGGSGTGGSGTGGSGGQGSTPPLDQECAEPESLADTSTPDHVVGNGTPASCTEAALRSAVEAGGVITFRCGSAPFTFALTDTLRPARTTCDWVPGPCSRQNTVIDGGGTITLDGRGAVRPITYDTADSEEDKLTLRVQRLTIVGGNSAPGAGAACVNEIAKGGGAIYLAGGNLVVIDSVFRDNHGPQQGNDVAGGAIYNGGLGTTTIIRSVFEDNTCASGGAVGGLASSLRIINSRIVNNRATGSSCGGNGGGVYQDGRGREAPAQGSTLEICGTTISSNECPSFGGAFFRTAYGVDQTSRIDRSTFDGNKATKFASALYLQGSTVTLTNSTLSNNEANGMALFIMDHYSTGYEAPGRLDMTNVTITGNRNKDWGECAVAVGGRSNGTWQNVTVSGNIGDKVPELAITAPDDGTLTINNSILQGCSKTVSGGHNLQWPASGTQCTSGIALADPQLGALADNGGPTQTRAPAAGGPAAGAGSSCAPVDQRNETRAAACTLGAYELK